MRLFVIFVVLPLLFSESRADDDKKEATTQKPATENAEKYSHDGVWKPKAAVLSGVFLPPPVIAGITLKIADGKYEVTVADEDESDQGTFTLDENTTPKRMTIKSVSGPNKGKTFLAIYEFKNADAMRVCYDLSGKDFPKEFKAPKDSEHYLVGYRRQAIEQGNDKNPETSAEPSDE